MGPIKEGIKCATMYAIAKQGMQTYEKHETNKQQQAVQQGQNQTRAPPAVQGSSFVHQAYCNGEIFAYNRNFEAYMRHMLTFG